MEKRIHSLSEEIESARGPKPEMLSWSLGFASLGVFGVGFAAGRWHGKRVYFRQLAEAALVPEAVQHSVGGGAKMKLMLHAEKDGVILQEATRVRSIEGSATARAALPSSKASHSEGSASRVPPRPSTSSSSSSSVIVAGSATSSRVPDPVEMEAVSESFRLRGFLDWMKKRRGQEVEAYEEALDEAEAVHQIELGTSRKRDKVGSPMPLSAFVPGRALFAEPKRIRKWKSALCANDVEEEEELGSRGK